jgi:hypothetical protein
MSENNCIDIGNYMILEFSLDNFKRKIEEHSKRVTDIEKLLSENDSGKISEYVKCINCHLWNSSECHECMRFKEITK